VKGSSLTDLDALFDELFPICRSITGPGIRSSFDILKRYLPLEVTEVPTGTKVFDWSVPPEWSLKRATLTDPDGALILDTDASNLHVLNFSIPFEGEVELDALQAHLHSIPELNDAVPYVTSYYQRRWGLCMSHRQRLSLEPGVYKVSIDTEIRDGSLAYAQCELPGETDEVVLITSYLCHPSLANNELSGPLGLVRLFELLKAMPSRRYTYRFLLVPETIGSISYLATEGKDLGDRIVGGVVLTCLGGPNSKLSFKMSRLDWTESPSKMDALAREVAALDHVAYQVRPFTPASGSDERQFCSPGVNWPVLQAARTIYGEYAEYHTSLDTKALMTIDAIERSALAVFRFLQLHEVSDLFPASIIEGGEPQLGRRDLYPTMNGPMSNTMSNDSTKDGRYLLDLLLNMLSLADGQRTIVDIARKIDVPLMDLLPILQTLVEKEILSLKVSAGSNVAS
jgi:aminopeptidase-like protein